jgi:hypothetical protein
MTSLAQELDSEVSYLTELAGEPRKTQSLSPTITAFAAWRLPCGAVHWTQQKGTGHRLGERWPVP